MTRPRDEDQLDPRYWAELGPGPGPDVTDEVLRRLGITPAMRARARRRRAIRAVMTSGLCAVAVAATVAGVYVYQQHASTAPIGPTIPSAIRNDLQHHGGTLDHAIRSIRNISPIWSVETGAEPELPGLPMPTVPTPSAQRGMSLENPHGDASAERPGEPLTCSELAEPQL